MDRCSEVAGRLERLGLNVARRTELDCRGWSGGRGPKVLVLDTIGELAGVYTAADFAFVGGTLAPFGGHNLVEPAAAGVPVLFGSSLESVRAVAEALVRSGGGIVVEDAGALAANLSRMCTEPEERKRRGAAARDSIESLGGAAGRTLEFLSEAGVLPESK
jgi:3-deoxy-D-manno-octulosonic-acid transferase